MPLFCRYTLRVYWPYYDQNWSWLFLYWICAYSLGSGEIVVHRPTDTLYFRWSLRCQSFPIPKFASCLVRFVICSRVRGIFLLFLGTCCTCVRFVSPPTPLVLGHGGYILQYCGIWLCMFLYFFFLSNHALVVGMRVCDFYMQFLFFQLCPSIGHRICILWLCPIFVFFFQLCLMLA